MFAYWAICLIDRDLKFDLSIHDIPTYQVQDEKQEDFLLQD